MNLQVTKKKNAFFGVLVFIFFSGFVFFSSDLIRFSRVAQSISNLPNYRLDAVILFWLSFAFLLQSLSGMLLALFYAILFFVRFFPLMESKAQLLFALLCFLAVLSFSKVFLKQLQSAQDKKKWKFSKKNVLWILFIGVFLALLWHGNTKVNEMDLNEVMNSLKTEKFFGKKQKSTEVSGVNVILKSGVQFKGKIIFEDPFFYTVLDQNGKEHIALKEEIVKIEALG